MPYGNEADSKTAYKQNGSYDYSESKALKFPSTDKLPTYVTSGSAITITLPPGFVTIPTVRPPIYKKMYKNTEEPPKIDSQIKY